MEDMMKPLGCDAMEHRKKMQISFSEKRGAVKGDTNFFMVDMADGKWYLGVEYAIEDSAILTWYYMPTGDREAVVFVYLGVSEPFDDFIWLLDDHVEGGRDIDFAEKMREFFPRLMRAYANTTSSTYSKPSLMKLFDPVKKGAECACLGMKIQPFNFWLPQYWLEDDAVSKALELARYVQDMADELNERGIKSIDDLAIFAKGFKVNRKRQVASLGKLAWRLAKFFFSGC